MGRRSSPIRQHLLTGTLNVTRHASRAHEPASGGQPVKPEWLTGEASKFWDWLLVELSKMGIGQSVDSAAIASLCRWWAEWRKSDELLQRCPDDDRYRAIIQAGLAWKNWTKAAIEFGLTPAARVRLATEMPRDESDPLLDMLQKRQSSN